MNTADLIIRSENPADLVTIRELNRLAFGRDEEAHLVDALRAGGHVRVSLVAVRNHQVVGHILFSELTIVTRRSVTLESLALAPMAVIPTHQRQGIGSMLLESGLRACSAAGHRSVIVLGHRDFYPRFGFTAKRAASLESPFSGPQFMAKDLVEGALDGVEGEVRYPEPFGVF